MPRDFSTTRMAGGAGEVKQRKGGGADNRGKNPVQKYQGDIRELKVFPHGQDGRLLRAVKPQTESPVYLAAAR